MSDIQFVPLSKIVFNRFQQSDAKDEAKVTEIASSINQHRDNGTKGLLQVPTARLLDDGRYELAFGHHRFMAFASLDDPFFSEMPLIVRELSDLEMFELMAIENFHRRDISPIEEAKTFHSYMETFGKTSVETAQKFEKTEEYVRQSIRLLNLPENVQQMVTSGTMTKTEARDMLVLEKVGGADLVAKALEALGDEDFDSPKEAISYALRQGSEWLDKNAAWFSASKNFPRKHLPALTVKDLEGMIHYAEGYGDGVPILVIKDLLTLISSGMEVTDEAFPQINPNDLERLRVLVNPIPCEKCPFHAVLDGSHHCGMKLCRERKKEAWAKKEFDDKIKKIGVPLLTKEDGPFLKLDHHSKADVRIWEEKGADLRVTSRAFSYMGNFEGLDNTTQAVVVGETYLKRKAALEKKAGKEKQNQLSEAELRDLNASIRAAKIQAMLKFSWNFASLLFASTLDGINSVDLLKFQFTEINSNPDFPEGMDEDEVLKDLDDMKKADALKHMRRVLTYAMIERYMYVNDIEVEDTDKKPVIKHANNLEEIAAAWEVKLPKDFMTRAEAYQAELDNNLEEIAAAWEVKLPKDFMTRAEAYQAELDQQLKELEPKKAKK